MSSPTLPRAVVHALTADPPRLLVVGGAHTGKTKLLNEIRQTLPHIVVVDDAHRLPADEIRNLADRMIHGDHGIVVATEPRPHRAEMLQLMSTGAAHACTVALQPSTLDEATSRAAAFGISDPTLVRACDCRKPAPGMLLKIASALSLDIGKSWMIGDSAADMEAARTSGMQAGLLFEPRRCELCPLRGRPDLGADVHGATLVEIAEAIRGGMY